MFSLPDNIFYMESGIYICFGTVLGSLISGGLLIINNSRNNEFQLERENQQRIWQEESERHKWFREKTYESYRKTIEILTNIIQLLETPHENTSDNKQKIFNLYFDFSSEFYIIIAGHPNKNSEKINNVKIIEILEMVDKNPIVARNKMIEIMQQDPRIKDVKEGYLNSEKSSTQSSEI